jgi:NAD-dependent deacetylase
MKSRRLVVFSGAGLSAESGLSTFRDNDGLWNKHKVEDVAHPDGWKTNKSLVLDFYANLFNRVRNAQPNSGHYALAKLERSFDVTHVTQNIDNLLERAGCTNVQHVHGSLFERTCESLKCPYKVHQTEPIRLGDVCKVCGGYMRPAVVWFSETVNMNKTKLRSLAWHTAAEGGVFIVVGTSANVYPAASMLDLFSRVRNKYYINLDPMPQSGFVNLVGKAGDLLPTLVDNLLETA